MEKNLRCGDAVHSVLVSRNADPVTAVVDGREVVCGIDRISLSEWIITRDGVQTRVHLARGRTGETFVQMRGHAFRISAAEEDFTAGSSDAAASGILTATMPGRVIKVLVTPGQQVRENQPVIIMESMKMEMTQNAPFDGTIAEINAQDGQQIDAGAVVVRIEPISPAQSV